VSPKKQKEIMNFIENKIMRMDRAEGKKLKRIRLEKNRVEQE
jgi:hypothetical protein